MQSYLSGEVGSASLGHLKDDGSLSIASSFERSYNGRGGGDILQTIRASISDGIDAHQ